MSTINIRLQYRPIRIGWCIEKGNFEELKLALEYTHTLWGGMYNPIIPIQDSDYADMVIKKYKVDALYPFSDDARLPKKEVFKNFLDKYSHLGWPIDFHGLFGERNGKKAPAIGDVANAMDVFKKAKNDGQPVHPVRYYKWDKHDPLHYVLLATVGNYPEDLELAMDYPKTYQQSLGADTYTIETGKPVPSNIFDFLNPHELTAIDLDRDIYDRGYLNGHPGLYIGDCTNFDDIVRYWNLRAADLEVYFYDYNRPERFEDLKNVLSEKIKKVASEREHFSPKVALWGSKALIEKIPSLQDDGIFTKRVYDTDDKGFLSRITSPLMFFKGHHTVLASLKEQDTPTISIQLPSKPIWEDDYRYPSEAFIVSVDSTLYEWNDTDYTFSFPNIPKLNLFYGKESYVHRYAVRAQAKGFGVIVDSSDSVIQVGALNKADLVREIFNEYGMQASLSSGGRVNAQLIKQMGGLRSCKVFKIEGVRELIEAYKPTQYFTRGNAEKIIGKIKDGEPLDFQDYEALYIEYRVKKKLTPPQVFDYLLKKGIFRAGIELNCPSCQLDFWLTLDEIKKQISCEYCDYNFSILMQLKDRAWFFRCSGLFGRDDHQEGGIPVSLTLLQLPSHFLGSAMGFYMTGTNVKSPSLPKCETDLFVYTQRARDGRKQIVIGECKSKSGKIIEDDIKKLTTLSQQFPSDEFDVFFVFSKTGTFTEDEIKLFRGIQPEAFIGDDDYRVILLSDRELNFEWPYEKTAEQYSVSVGAISLEDRALKTHKIFFSIL